MSAEWTKKANTLTWFRVGAVIMFLALASGIFTDWEDNEFAFKFIVPFTYLYTWKGTSIRDISVLIVPLLINIALWIPCYRSYVFLKVVLHVEYCKFLLMLPFLLFALPFSPLFQRNNPAPIFFISLIMIFIIRILIKKLKQEDFVQYFKLGNKSQTESDRTLRFMIFTLGFIVLAGHILDMHVTRNTIAKHAPIQTYELHHPELRYLATDSKDGNPYIYSDKPISSVADKAKLSIDERQLLVRLSSQDDMGKDLFIFDTTNMTNTKILQTLVVEYGSRTKSGYTFTNDGKQIIVGDEPSVDSKIKFQMLDVNTGKRVDRFSDPNSLSKLNSLSGTKDVDIIEFNPSGKYFAVVMKSAQIIEIWDYESGKLVFTDLLVGIIKKFVWLTDKEFIVVSRYNIDKQIIDNGIEQYIILDNKSSINVEKKRLYFSLPSKDSSRSWDIIACGKYVATKIGKERNISNADEFDRLSIWNAKNEKQIFEYKTTNILKDMEFYPDGRNIVYLEILPDKTGKITIWNIANESKERTISTPSIFMDIENSSYKIKILDNGKKLMVIGKKIYIVSLE